MVLRNLIKRTQASGGSEVVEMAQGFESTDINDISTISTNHVDLVRILVSLANHVSLSNNAITIAIFIGT